MVFPDFSFWRFPAPTEQGLQNSCSRLSCFSGAAIDVGNEHPRSIEDHAPIAVTGNHSSWRSLV
jgi:hypothetical protein